MEEKKVEKEFRDKVLRFGLITLVICILLEIFVFNYKSFTLLGGKYNQRTIPVSEAQVTGASESMEYILHRTRK
mgnify:CR=1 FL=1